MKFTVPFPAFLKRHKKHTVVTFTGGMGAQIISAAIYFSLESEGRLVYADFSYFDKQEHVAIAGSPGECSHWSWQLEAFGLHPSSFEKTPSIAERDIELIEDGPQKLALGIKALRRPDIQKRFDISRHTDDILPSEFSNNYLCIHVRRGDYVNVASHLVSDHEFIGIATKFSGLFRHIVIISDSEIPQSFRQAISQKFEQAIFLDKADVFTSHRIMRNARALICSNSQFSLIAALLNSSALVVLPRQWFGADDRKIEIPIHEACNFQILI
jgi:hypothetical protein